MNVTHAALQDARAVAEIHVNAWQEAYQDIFSAEYLASLSIDQRHAWWQQAIATQQGQLLVAKTDGTVRGWLHFGASREEAAPADQAEVMALYVAPGHWSTGTGRALWLHARQLMLEGGFSSCSLWVLAQNARAIRFYDKAGFVPDAWPPQRLARDGKVLHEIRHVHRFQDGGGTSENT